MLQLHYNNTTLGEIKGVALDRIMGGLRQKFLKERKLRDPVKTW